MPIKNPVVTQEQFIEFLNEETARHKQQKEDVREIKERVITAEAQLAKHSGALFGNGKIGIDEHIRNIWSWVEEQKEKAKRDTVEKMEEERERRRARVNLQNSLILLFVSQIVTIIISIWLGR